MTAPARIPSSRMSHVAHEVQHAHGQPRAGGELVDVPIPRERAAAIARPFVKRRILTGIMRLAISERKER